MLIHWKHHLPYEITQHYLPPNTSECTCLKAGHYSICLPWRDNRLRWPVFSQCCNHGLCGSNNPVTPSCDHNDFKSPTIAVSRSCRSVAVLWSWLPLSCRLVITPNHRSQRIAAFLHCMQKENRPTVLRLCSDYTVTVPHSQYGRSLKQYARFVIALQTV